MDRFMNQLRNLDPELHQRLVQQDIKPQFYAFRWITLLLSQVRNLNNTKISVAFLGVFSEQKNVQPY